MIRSIHRSDTSRLGPYRPIRAIRFIHCEKYRVHVRVKERILQFQIARKKEIVFFDRTVGVMCIKIEDVDSSGWVGLLMCKNTLVYSNIIN